MSCKTRHNCFDVEFNHSYRCDVKEPRTWIGCRTRGLPKESLSTIDLKFNADSQERLWKAFVLICRQNWKLSFLFVILLGCFLLSKFLTRLICYCDKRVHLLKYIWFQLERMDNKTDGFLATLTTSIQMLLEMQALKTKMLWQQQSWWPRI